MRHLLCTFVLAVCCASAARAQDIPDPEVVNTNDFRGRVEGTFEWEPIDDLSIEAGVQLRLNNDLGSVDCFQTSVGAK